MTSGPRPDLTDSSAARRPAGQAGPPTPIDGHRPRGRLDATDGRRYPARAPHFKRANLSQILDAGQVEIRMA